MYPWFNALINHRYEFGPYELNHECARTHNNEYPWFITALNHGYRCFISILTRVCVPLKCDALVFCKSYVDRMSFGSLFLGITLKFHFRRL